jgi:BASS family bile acid:Na+ symporter
MLLRYAIKIINHRNFVLILSFVAGLALGEKVEFLAESSLYVLAFIMMVTTTAFSFKSWLPVKKALYPVLFSSFLNYVVFSLLLIGVSWYLMPSRELWVGFVIIAAAPPGVAIIPFSAMLKGDIDFSISGVFGAHITAMAFAPLILIIFLGNSLIDPVNILIILVELIVIPLIISRFLRHPKTLTFFDRYRGKITNWGFFFVITPIIGLNKKVFFSDIDLLLLTSLVFVICMFVLGFIYQLVMQQTSMSKRRIVSSTLMMTIKSSAFAAVTAFKFLDVKAALPAAVLSVFVIIYIIAFPYLKPGELKS